jgi:hypothetical protein
VSVLLAFEITVVRRDSTHFASTLRALSIDSLPEVASVLEDRNW